MQKFIGLLLLLAGVYFLGKDIIFSTHYSPFFWRSLPAMGSVLALMGGIISLVFFPRQTGSFGWVLLALGVVFVFLNGGVFLKPTSLWNFFVAFGAMACGYKLMTERRFRI